MNLQPLIIPGMNVPMVIAASDSRPVNPHLLVSFIAEHYDEIMAQLNQYGAVVFRGFSCHDAQYFSNVVAACDLGRRCSTKDYDLPRTVLADEIYTSSDFPSHIFLPLHHEKPRSKNPPNHIYFCCATPAQQGGGTLFANAAVIWRDIPKNIQDKIIKYGVLYQQFFHGKTMKYGMLKKLLGEKSVRSWSDYFGTSERRVVEERLVLEAVDWSWVNQGNHLIIINKLPGALQHPLTGQTLWFNASEYLNYYSNLRYTNLKALPFYQYMAMQYLLAKDRLPMVCHYGNGQAFSFDEIKEIKRIMQRHTHVFHWQKGDFMIVDNFTFMHGKEPHQGERLLYSCMTQKQETD